MESGWIYRVDFYNKFGLKYASEFRDTAGNVESRVFYSDGNQEVLVEQPEMTFHIAANTLVSDKLNQLGERENVNIYPCVSRENWPLC